MPMIVKTNHVAQENFCGCLRFPVCRCRSPAEARGKVISSSGEISRENWEKAGWCPECAAEHWKLIKEYAAETGSADQVAARWLLHEVICFLKAAGASEEEMKVRPKNDKGRPEEAAHHKTQLSPFDG